MCEKYNGWQNYATWRVNLEIFDAISWVKEDFFSSDDEIVSVYDLANTLQSIAEDTVTQQNTLEGLVVDYALAFMRDVDYLEIARAMAERHPDWGITEFSAEDMRRIQNYGTQHHQWKEYQKAKKQVIKALGKEAWEKAVSNTSV